MAPKINSKPSSSSSSSSSSSRNHVLAATAGRDTWKTWAGRKHGTSSFEVLDIFRGAKREFRSLWTTTAGSQKTKDGKSPSSEPCPICFDTVCSDGWYTISTCGHVVCLTCFRGYAASQVNDPQRRRVTNDDDDDGLKCPVCSLSLRKKDAIVAIGHDESVLKVWDEKMRDEVIRALPHFRYCPQCPNDDDKNDGISSSRLGGGGFVTPACLKSCHDTRTTNATKILSLTKPLSQIMFLLSFFILVRFYMSRTSSEFGFLCCLASLPRLLTTLSHAWDRHILAKLTRRALFSPIVVGCPCCHQDFILDASSELAGLASDDATARWISTNARACPNCNVWISKEGGCNHVKCGHCGCNFCWACMRSRTVCAAYRCRNGAPFGNALPSPQREEGGDDDDGRQRRPRRREMVAGTIMERIHVMERRSVQLGKIDIVGLLWLFTAAFPVQDKIKVVMTTLFSIYPVFLLETRDLLSWFVDDRIQ